MKIFKHKVLTEDDSKLVLSALRGNQQAFCKIVSRYQNLLCAIAYSSTGDIKHSEDLAQEAFIEAWKKLDTLKDPTKIKAWLCGILRFKICHFHRKKEAQLATGSNEAENSREINNASQLEESVIKVQEQDLLWQTLHTLDETYREPLVLYYREDQSIEQVAVHLDLSLDTAKQRLSRGRKQLKHAMSAYIENALANSKPAAGFTAAVLTSIQSIAPPAQAATISVVTSKSTGLLNWTSVLTTLASISGLISAFLGLKTSLIQSRTQQERQHAIKAVALFLLTAFIFTSGLFGLKYLAADHVLYQFEFVLLAQLLVGGFIISYLILVNWLFKKTRQLRAHARIFDPQAFHRAVDQKNSKAREFKSKLTLLGVPLIHIQLATPEINDKPAFGWVAGGSQAHGLLFAWGGVAIAPVSVGIISVGILSIGAVGFGIFGLGSVGIGLIGFGAAAIGYKAYASMSALGWDSAVSGGFSIAQNAAIGPFAYASQTNNPLAETIVNMALLNQTYLWVLAAISLFVIVPALCYFKKVKQRMQ